MLGTRTKHVVAYGRRGHRIISVDDRENGTPVKKKFDNTLDPRQTLVAGKTKMTYHFPSESPSPPRRVHARNSKPKRLSPAHSPAALKKKRARVPSLVEADTAQPTAVRPPLRRPLSSVHTNVPATPVPTKGKKKTQLARVAGSPPFKNAGKPPSPFVDVDIIMLDNNGQRVSQERRVSRMDVVTNPVAKRDGAKRNGGKAALAKSASKEPEVILVSDSEEEAAPKPTKRGTKHRNRAIVSSDESEIEETSPPANVKPKAIKLAKTMTMEVLIPVIKPAAKPQAAAAIPAKRPSRPVIPVIKPATKSQVAATIPSNLPLRPPSPTYATLPLSPAPRVAATKPFKLPPRPSSPTYTALTLPQAPRARPLTPIRMGGNRNLFRAPSPPSPTTPTNFDSSLDFDFEALSLNSLPDDIVPPGYLIPLLEECAQDAPHEFSAFIETFPFDPIVQPLDDNITAPTDIVFRKIGEASYSEVFGIGNVVLKVIPLRDETLPSDLPLAAAASDAETPFPSDSKDVLNEMMVTRAVGEVCDGFIKLLRTYVVRGRYPELLLSLWDEYDTRKGSEGVRPDGFNVSQAYAIIVLPNGGPDLEAYTFATPSKNGWRQASSLFWQITSTLARAEELVEFEHRDLHWGQILVRNTSDIAKAPARRQSALKAPMNHTSHGVEATIIDLGLARMDGGEGAQWTPFDAEIFEGEGDYQFDVYRMMKGGVGAAYKPVTNIMWLHYLVLKLLHSKRLKPPAVSRKPVAAKPMVFTEKECYDSLIEMESVLAKSVKQATKRPGKKTTKVVANASLCSAGHVFQHGVDRGWVHPCT